MVNAAMEYSRALGMGGPVRITLANREEIDANGTYVDLIEGGSGVFVHEPGKPQLLLLSVVKIEELPELTNPPQSSADTPG